MSWRDVDLEMGVWIVPPEITKNGRPHKIPLPPKAVAILRSLPWLAKSDLVFPGRHGRVMTGWSKRLPKTYKATAAAGMTPWTPHDCRRTMRTGLGQLGVEPVVAELLLDHAVSAELAKIYDRGEYWHLRVEASARWAKHVLGLVEGDAPRWCRSGEGRGMTTARCYDAAALAVISERIGAFLPASSHDEMLEHVERAAQDHLTEPSPQLLLLETSCARWPRQPPRQPRGEPP